jgi:hypothetical protein
MLKTFLTWVRRLTGPTVLTKEQRLERLQVDLVKAIRHGRDEFDGSAVELAIRADALFKQTDKSFDERCQDVHGALVVHSANKLLNRLQSYSH